jgi:hypothetical protein
MGGRGEGRPGTTSLDTGPLAVSTCHHVRVATTPTTQLDKTPYVTAWLIHRLAIGVMGVAMPIILIVGERILFSRDVVTFPRASLSAYYYSGLREIFTGTLIATGVFLITFKLTHANIDNIITAIAGIGAIGVALFPTGPDRGEISPPWARLIGVHTTQVIHSISACLFIGALALMSHRFARNAARWSWIHDVCAFVMVGVAVAAFVAGSRGVETVGVWSGLLIVELTCTFAFGISWLVRGYELRRELV